MDLPQSLRAALEHELSSLPAGRLTALATTLSQRYREGSESSRAARHVRSKEDAATYAAFRMPATYAAIHNALRQTRNQLPGWTPATLLDVGAGPGTAMWAATGVWPVLKRVVLLEREDEMIRIGQNLAAGSELAAIREAEWRRADLAGPWEVPPCDLVVASYVFGEMSATARTAVARKLWEAACGVLLVVEPGTPRGFFVVRQLRNELLAAGARIAAPCPHDRECPGDWCHFSQRISRTHMHRQAKSGDLSYEDEKFSFAAFSRLEPRAIQARIVRHPRIHKGHVQFEVCTADGLQNTVVTRKDKDLYRRSRDWQWGDAVTALEEDTEMCYSEREPRGR